MTDDIVAFISARLDEDGRFAKAAAEQFARMYPGLDDSGVWTAGNVYWTDTGVPNGVEVWAAGDTDATVIAPGELPAGEHIARHDPARVLRAVEAKRRLITGHRPGDPFDFYEGGHQPQCRGDHRVLTPYLCPPLRLLASEWSDHAEYRESWRP